MCQDETFLHNLLQRAFELRAVSCDLRCRRRVEVSLGRGSGQEDLSGPGSPETFLRVRTPGSDFAHVARRLQSNNARYDQLVYRSCIGQILSRDLFYKLSPGTIADVCQILTAIGRRDKRLF